MGVIIIINGIKVKSVFALIDLNKTKWSVKVNSIRDLIDQIIADTKNWKQSELFIRKNSE